jgi:hypothetical protein
LGGLGVRNGFWRVEGFGLWGVGIFWEFEGILSVGAGDFFRLRKFCPPRVPLGCASGGLSLNLAKGLSIGLSAGWRWVSGSGLSGIP